MTRVERGAAYLDRHFGSPDWRKRIDLDRLNLSDCKACVLGQLFRHYQTALDERLQLSFDESDAMGFSTSDYKSDAWERLTLEWREYLAASTAREEVEG